MTDHLKSATDYLALGESSSPGDAADMVQLSIAHSLAGLLAHVTRTVDWENLADTAQTVPVEDVPRRECILCGRIGQRWYEATPAGLICSHYAKCAARREENNTD